MASVPTVRIEGVEVFQTKNSKKRAPPKPKDDNMLHDNNLNVENTTKKRERSSTIDNGTPWNTRLWNISDMKIRETLHKKKAATPQTTRREKEKPVPIREHSIRQTSKLSKQSHSLELNIFNKKNKEKHKNSRLLAQSTLTEPTRLSDDKRGYGYLQVKIKGKKYKKRWIVLQEDTLFCYRVMSVSVKHFILFLNIYWMIIYIYIYLERSY